MRRRRSRWVSSGRALPRARGIDDEPAGGVIGLGFDEFLWPRPTRAGDELHIETEVLEVRPSESCPDQRLIEVRTKTLNQDGEVVQAMVGNRMVQRLPK